MIRSDHVHPNINVRKAIYLGILDLESTRVMKKADFEDVNQIRLIHIHYASFFQLMLKHTQLVKISLQPIYKNARRIKSQHLLGLCVFTFISFA